VSANKAKSLAYSVIQHVSTLLNSPVAPEIPPELEDMEELHQLRAQFMEMRQHLTRVSRGDLSEDIKTRGFSAGLLKRHLANLRHLTWQVEQVSRGDFTQRVDFMGDFSKAFNNMVIQLDTTLTSLRTTEEALTRLTNSLRQEVEMRTSAVNALKQSEARFKYLADHDPLTGALNRRSFLLIAETGLRNAQQSGKACSFAMLDVDHFKKFNDTYGHLDGDMALKHVVKLSQSNLRQSDCMGRYGGEEFIFYFADADREQGFRAAERIRKAIAEHPVQLESGAVSITASMGVSTVRPQWPGERDSHFLQKMVLMADAAMYESKQQGRDRVTLASERPPHTMNESDEGSPEDWREMI
jgi:diguanylate cyclase (GGDEF)-like protein